YDGEPVSGMSGAQRFGHEVDAVEAGRRGGLASGIARQPAVRKQRELEAKVLASKNGAAQVKLLQLSLERRYRELKEREIALDIRQRKVTAAEREVHRWDDTLCELMDEADAEQAKLEKLEAEVAELGRVRNLLRANVEAEADAQGLEVVE